MPDIGWYEVLGGTVTLEGVEGSFEVKPFLIARYPVSYRQYKAFLDDPEGYRAKRWWKGLKHEAEPGEQYRQIGTCPAETVSWWDARAYCRWLSARLGYEVRLPTEPEWQQAATGGNPSNEYPWGPDWIEGRANTFESRLGRSTAVGMYPNGASPQGILDLAGNVWECCLTDYERPDAGDGGLGERDQRDEARRVVRGGSWLSARDDPRGAFRGHDHPGLRSDGIGFRVVRGSPIP